MADGKLVRALGKGDGYNVHSEQVSAADGDSYDTGLDSIVAAHAEVRGNDAGTAGAYRSATADPQGDGTVQFNVAVHDGTDGGSAETNAQDIDLTVVGEV